MRYLWNPGWRGAVLVLLLVFFPALALVFRRKWKIAEIRRAKVMSLVRLAVAEAEMAEKEAAAFIYAVEKPVSAVTGGGIGMPNCAVCNSPTTTRCSRCKAVKYCSGNCQITHWRQGHKYECHPPHFDDHYKGQPNVSDLKGVQDERPEISGNGLGIEEKGPVTHDGFYIDHSFSNMVGEQSKPSVLTESRSGVELKPDDTKTLEKSSTVPVSSEYQSFSNMVGAQSELSVLAVRRSGIKVQPDDTKPLETSSTIPVSSESNPTLEIHSENGEDGEKHFMSTSEKSLIIGPESSSYYTISGPVEIPDNDSSNEDLTKAAIGPHANANTHDNLEESSSSRSPDGLQTSVIDAVQVNLPTFPHATEIASSLSFASFSSDLKPDSTYVNGETEFKSTAAETITFADSTKSQSCHSIHHPRLDIGLHSELSVRLSSKKSCSAAASRGRSDLRKTVSLVIGNSGEVAENNNEQLKSSSPLKDHSASIGHGQSLPRNGSPKVENVLPVTDKSVKFDGSLPNGKVSFKRTVQLITSSSLSRHSQSGHCNYGYGKYNCKMLFPYDNFIRLYNSDKVEMRPCGLVNCGNSCYVNVVLQCLAFTRPLAAFILEGLHAKACPKKGWCFTCEFETLIIKAKQGKSPVSPTGIISHIHDIGSNFGHGREEDAHEFLRYSIDAMQSVCLKEAGAGVVSQLTEETTLIQLIFGGYLRSKIKCMRCQGKSERRERMMDLTIDIHGDIGTLEEALARYTASEVLEGENKYKCSRCKSFERAKKQLTILEAPNVLTIALKRYQSGKYGKLNKMVRFSEYLNLAPYMRGSDDNSPVYRLYAVVVHDGLANATFSGHYVCYVKNTQGKWFKADDSVVKQVELQKVLSQGAYMLLYARCSPRAPSLLRKEMAKKSKSKEREDAHCSKIGNKVKHSHAGHRTDYDLFEERFRRPPKMDSSSDISSLFSYSDEGSCWSTESTKDSEEFTEYSFGSDGVASSPNSSRRVSVSSESSSSGLKVEGEGGSGGEGGSQGERTPFLYSIKHYKKLTEQCSSRRDSDWVNSSEAKSNVLFRRSSGDRAAQNFY